MAEGDGEASEIEQQIVCAISSRIQHFKDQADSLTMESVRRLLEKDLGFEKFELDAHKRFIRQYLEKKMDAGDEYSTKTESENAEDANLNKEEAAISPKSRETKNNLKKSSSGDLEMMEDSPIMGVLTPKSEADAKASPVSESVIKKAIWKRADHFLANSENITLAAVRRLLEEDLGLDKNTLDSFKKFINQEIDQVLNPPKVAKSMKDIKKKTSESVKSKKSKEISSDESNSSGSGSDNEMEDKVKSRKRAASRRNVKVEAMKKRKTSECQIDGSGNSKPAKRQKGEDNESDVDGSLSEDGQSQPSIEKSVQRKDKSTPAYGKRVEHLKSIIKACGMSVAPSIYKKAKQVPENKRESFIVKELEDILSKEGLSENPSEKEIKNCRKRKETARELEGIDMSNIISSSRRRSTCSFTTPVKPEIRAKKDKIAAKGNKSKDSSDKGHNKDNEEEEKNEENEKKDNEKLEEKKEDEKVEEKKEDEKEEEEGEGGDEEEEVEEEEDDDAGEETEEDEEDESEEFNEDDSD